MQTSGVNAPDKLAGPRERVQADPWDLEAWKLLSAAASSQPIEVQKAIFEDLLSRFPTAATHWKAYAEAEMEAGNQSQVKAIFSRSLLNCLSLALWQTYLRFIKQMNEGKGPEGMLEVRKAYEFALDRVGCDVGAGPLWQEYTNFLQAPRPGTTAFQALYSQGVATGQEEAHRTATLRKSYQRALAVPMERLELLWRAYEQFELAGSNKLLARRSIEEQRSRFNAAKAAFPERKRRLSPLLDGGLALPPGKGGWEQQQAMVRWKEYIEWERSNPQSLDGPALTARISLAYDQALMYLLHYPEMWHAYAKWHREGGGAGPSAGSTILGRARKVVNLEFTRKRLKAA
ncbi:hypothetical protein WJX84_008660 [Apatococcus fuscideae]|uniref:Suppressor of forked domain-containing protein n=1 Tax=Apatococcus fuscideae TaxID=2026836 RepID=A0AAW1SV59_9CHLO